jgi:hypothetical protein
MEGNITNTQRADRIAYLIDEDWHVRDVLADIMHLCAQQGTDFEEEFYFACRNFTAEVAEEADA